MKLKLDPTIRWDFQPHDFVPFKDREVCDRVSKISGKDLEKHPNPDFRIKVMLNPHPVLIGRLFTLIKESDEQNKRCVLILGNPEPDTYLPLAELINYHGVNCRNVHIFAMDEWADQDGKIAPLTYEASLARHMLKYLYEPIEEKNRMPLENVHYPTNENIGHYSKLITETGDGGADFCSSSPGWSGHMAFIDPVNDFIKPTMEEYLKQEAAVVNLHPLTIAQNSLHGIFGTSGNIANVPPKAATIGPVDVYNARERMEVHALQTYSTFSSWQRMVSRLILHGPVTPLVPSSMLQLMKTQVYVSQPLAEPFSADELAGY